MRTPGHASALVPVWTDDAQIVAHDDHALVLFDGEAWSDAAPGGTIEQVWARSFDEVWIATTDSPAYFETGGKLGSPGQLLCWDGAKFQVQLEPSPTADKGLNEGCCDYINGFTGVTGDPETAELWVLEVYPNAWCDGANCDSSAPTWIFDGADWTEAPELLEFGEAKLHYFNGTPWATGRRESPGLARWTALGWENPLPDPINGFMTPLGLWVDGDEIWMRNYHLHSGFSYFEHYVGQAGTSSEHFEDASFGPAWAGWPGKLPMVVYAADELTEPALVEVDGVDPTPLVEGIVPSHPLAAAPGQVLLGASGGVYSWVDQVDLDAEAEPLTRLHQRLRQSCARLVSFGDTLVGMHSAGTTRREGAGPWTVGFELIGGSSYHMWLSDPSHGWASWNPSDEGPNTIQADLLRIEDGVASPSVLPGDPNFIDGLWGVSATEVYLSTYQDPGYVFNGVEWALDVGSPIDNTSAFEGSEDGAVFSSNSTEVFRRWGDQGWVKISNQGARGLLPIAHDELWARGADGARWWHDGEWTDAVEQWPALAQLGEITSWVGHGEELWFYGEGVLLHFDGQVWAPVVLPAAGIEEHPRVSWVDGELILDDCVNLWTLAG